MHRAVPRRRRYAGRRAAVTGRGARAAQQVPAVDGLTRGLSLGIASAPDQKPAQDRAVSEDWQDSLTGFRSQSTKLGEKGSDDDGLAESALKVMTSR